MLLDDGLTCAKVAKVLYLDDDTVRSRYKHCRSGGIDELSCSIGPAERVI